MTEPVLITREEGGITLLTLNRPALRNPISDPDMLEALLAALADADADPATRVIILTGAGGAFSSGGNLNAMRPGAGLIDAAPVGTRQNYRHGIHRLPLLMARLEVPVIAAVAGPAAGAGCDLACMADLRIAGQSALFIESFVKIGLISGDGGAWLLPRVVGFAKAAEMALTGDPVDAPTALACGLVSQVVPDADLPQAALALARRIAANPPHAVRMTKRLLWEARRADLATILEMAGAMQSLAHATNDHAEAVDAFLAKRPARFTGS
ncbi:MAG TPA: crotonase/enoyl-CoA hydratase family protein [Novosphingobium sp.]|nr:crotonase/enoyl-CoA hydratase family protein [Novosphingobium sp.]HZV10873.1 crotonase/enoyl-CoA hydratase family protein [Novosphingobium sp.]